MKIYWVFFFFGLVWPESKIVVTFAYIIIMFFFIFQFYCYSGQRTGVVRAWSARRFPIQFTEIMFRCINFRKHSTKFLRFLFFFILNSLNDLSLSYFHHTKFIDVLPVYLSLSFHISLYGQLIVFVLNFSMVF